MNNADDLAALWDEYHTGIYGYAYKRVHDPDIADDIVSEVFLRALVATRNNNGWRTNARAWLFAIARSELYDRWRYWRGITVVSDDEIQEVDSSFDTHATAVRNIVTERVHDAIDNLIDNHSEAIRLRLQDYEYTEIAAMRGTTPEATKQHVVRGRKILRKSLEDVVALYDKAA